jgi:hypothetical protein
MAASNWMQRNLHAAQSKRFQHKTIFCDRKVDRSGSVPAATIFCVALPKFVQKLGKSSEQGGSAGCAFV